MYFNFQETVFIISVIVLKLNYVVVGKILYNTRDVPMKRITEFVPKIADKTCLLTPEKGPCRANLLMYYYQPEKETCNTFKWGGCQGNGNRFDTMEECMDHCLTKANAPKFKPKFCELAFDYGYCFGATYRWYFDKLWKVCKKTIYSGCGGNKNNFYMKEHCDQQCLYGGGKTVKEIKPDYHKILIIDPKGSKFDKKLKGM